MFLGDYSIGDEVVLRDGTRAVVTYVGFNELIVKDLGGNLERRIGAFDIAKVTRKAPKKIQVSKDLDNSTPSQEASGKPAPPAYWTPEWWIDDYLDDWK